MGKFLRNKDGKPNTLRDHFQIGDYTLGSLTATSLTVTGNVTTSGGNFVGDGSALTGVTATPAGSNTELQYNDGGSLGASANLTYNDSTNILSAPVIATNEIASPDSSILIINDGVAMYGDVSTTGSMIVDDSVSVENNITMNGGTIQIEGQSGNVSANNISVGNIVTVTGNLTGGNLITAGLVSATGNVTGGNLTTGGRITTSGPAIIGTYATFGAQVTAYSLVVNNTSTLTGNVSGGNVSLSGQLSATGNVTGGNLVTSADVTTATVTASGNISTGGILSVDVGTHEQFSSLSSATGTVTHDCSNGHIFYHTSPSADFTANFTNLNLGNTYATTTTLVMIQGATARIANAVQIGGSSETINWQGGSEPTGTNNGIDVITFSILNNAGTYTVLGQLVDF